jgi:hypothetical protein
MFRKPHYNAVPGFHFLPLVDFLNVSSVHPLLDAGKVLENVQYMTWVTFGTLFSIRGGFRKRGKWDQALLRGFQCRFSELVNVAPLLSKSVNSPSVRVRFDYALSDSTLCIGLHLTRDKELVLSRTPPPQNIADWEIGCLSMYLCWQCRYNGVVIVEHDVTRSKHSHILELKLRI